SLSGAPVRARAVFLNPQPRRQPRLHQHPRRVVDLFYSAIIAAFTRNGHRPRRGFDGIWPLAAILPKMTPARRTKTGESAACSDDPVIRRPCHPERRPPHSASLSSRAKPCHPERSEGSRFARDVPLTL